MISSPFSRLQTIWGLGCPLALQDRVIFSPSLTTRLGLSSLEIILGGTENKKDFLNYHILVVYLFLMFKRLLDFFFNNLPTTSKYPERCLIGSVLIWHIYQPRSLGWTLWSCKIQTLAAGLFNEILGFLVITLLWIVRMVWVSTLTHATWKNIYHVWEHFLLNNTHKLDSWVPYPKENGLCIGTRTGYIKIDSATRESISSRLSDWQVYFPWIYMQTSSTES